MRKIQLKHGMKSKIRNFCDSKDFLDNFWINLLLKSISAVLFTSFFVRNPTLINFFMSFIQKSFQIFDFLTKKLKIPRFCKKLLISRVFHKTASDCSVQTLSFFKWLSASSANFLPLTIPVTFPKIHSTEKAKLISKSL